MIKENINTAVLFFDAHLPGKFNNIIISGCHFFWNTNYENTFLRRTKQL